jgi:GTP-binding protein LepA
MDRLQLNDSSFTFAPENSDALGLRLPLRLPRAAPHGDHPGAAGARVQHRGGPDRPDVTYEIALTDGSTKRIDSPSELPNPTHIAEIREPYILNNLILPADSVGAMMKLCEDRRGIYKKTEYIGATRVLLQYEMPLAK